MSDQNPTAAGFTPLPNEKSPSTSSGQPLAKVATQQVSISRADIEKFGIDEEYAKKNPVLIDLILKTESMKDEERKYWFQLLPIMSDEQVKKLEGILQNEKDQLAELDKKYEKEITKLNEKQSGWSAEAATEKRKKVEAEEAVDQEKEKGEEEDILNQLENL